MVTVQFACGQEDRLSEVFGPYEYVECTYNGLYTPDREDEIAFYNLKTGWWQTKDQQQWSDFTVVAKEDSA